MVRQKSQKASTSRSNNSKSSQMLIDHSHKMNMIITGWFKLNCFSLPCKFSCSKSTLINKLDSAYFLLNFRTFMGIKGWNDTKNCFVWRERLSIYYNEMITEKNIQGLKFHFKILLSGHDISNVTFYRTVSSLHLFETFAIFQSLWKLFLLEDRFTGSMVNPLCPSVMQHNLCCLWNSYFE